ncbi:hypothetical protein HMPREF1548_02239 [Clostridium sp. KLE 1755]|nr:hypothetical protein HMPREF1548_02239 [Clostridium sp. KLE 1755]
MTAIKDLAAEQRGQWHQPVHLRANWFFFAFLERKTLLSKEALF